MATAKKSTLKAYQKGLIYKDRGSKVPIQFVDIFDNSPPMLKSATKRVGYNAHGGIYMVETARQKIFWKDKGGEIEFKGILQKEAK
jgi:hypothetical protein